MARTKEPGRDAATMNKRAHGMHARGKTRAQIAATLGVSESYARQLVLDHCRFLQQQEKVELTLAKAIRLLEHYGYNVTKKPEE